MPMSETKPIIISNQQVCPRCGLAFTCGIAVGEGECWCFQVPNLPSLTQPGEGASRCLCPLCLRDLVEREERRQSS